ncbi:CPBP family intramembrane metalloprotease [Amylibacter sp.]|nr:CPBP family intramembrane metalloprotease [Amylibacter sp.]MDB4078778.1 CPBP family intramembrane metalloprotease [Amylibacter sp.]MDB4133272.1 CPBP family intramembrane metalloprotease [Amylibacter sp.]
MNKKFIQFIEPAQNEYRWWIVSLTLVLWALFYMLLSSFFILIMSKFLNLDNLSKGLFTTPLEVYILLSTFLIWLAVFLFWVKLFHKRGLNSLIGGPKLTFLKNFFYAIILAGIFLVSTQSFIPNNDEIIENLNFSRWLTVLPLGIFLMFFQVTAEELLFRGYLQQQFAVWIKSRWFFMVMPSLIFGLMHYDGSMGVNVGLTLVAVTAILGLFLADLTYRTGNLGAAIGVHFANNFSAMFLVSYQEQISGLSRYIAPDFFNTPEMFYQAAQSMLITSTIIFLIYFIIMEWRARR